ncbi:MAG: LysE family transporter [Anaerolineales bacterium]|nr:LysE family transporter [Anaerolineales bacterium]
MTENLNLFLRGFIIGISIAAPVGPIGVLCIRRTLTDGKLKGFLSGMGAASADMVYGAIAAFGLTLVTDLLVENALWLKLIGGSFLLYLGIKTFLEKPAEQAAQVKQSGYFGAYLSTFFLTITNPMTILSFAAIFAGTMFIGTSNSPLVIVAGVFLGSACWWLALSFGVGFVVRGRLDQNRMIWINRISGTVITVFGIVALLS